MPALSTGNVVGGVGSAPPSALGPPGSPGSNPNAATGATGNVAIPGADQYAAAEVLANNAYAQAVAQLNQQRLNTLTSYGYRGRIDPNTGVLSNLGVDAHAPYGHLQELLHGHAVEDQHAMYGSQDRGLSGGLAHQALSELHYGHGSDLTHLGEALGQQLSDYQGQQQQDAETRDSALWQAEQAATDAATQNQLGEDITTAIQSLGSGKPSSSSTSSGSSPAAGSKPAKQGQGAHAGRSGRRSRAARQHAINVIQQRRRRRAHRGIG